MKLASWHTFIQFATPCTCHYSNSPGPMLYVKHELMKNRHDRHYTFNVITEARSRVSWLPWESNKCDTLVRVSVRACVWGVSVYVHVALLI